MQTKPITSIKTKSRNPFIAFLLSLAFTGLGQIYNGNISKGIVLFSIQVISLMILPVYIIINQTKSYLYIFIFLIFLSILMTIVSSIQALYYSIKNKNIPLKRYNSLIFYALYSIINISMTSCVIFIILSFFNVEKVTNKDSGPLISYGEYILINKYILHDYKKGELIRYDDNAIGRIIGISGDTITYQNNIFYVNNKSLPFGVINDNEMNKLSLDFHEDLLFEKNNDLKYPINLKITKTDKTNKSIKINKGTIFIAKDNRLRDDFMGVIPIDSIKGRIEGIIFSKRMKKMFLIPYIM